MSLTLYQVQKTDKRPDHILIFSRSKIEGGRKFYLYQSIKEGYNVRELKRQISASLF